MLEDYDCLKGSDFKMIAKLIVVLSNEVEDAMKKEGISRIEATVKVFKRADSLLVKSLPNGKLDGRGILLEIAKMVVNQGIVPLVPKKGRRKK